MLALSVATARAEQLTELGGLAVGLRCAPHVDPGQEVVLTERTDIKKAGTVGSRVVIVTFFVFQEWLNLNDLMQGNIFPL